MELDLTGMMPSNTFVLKGPIVDWGWVTANNTWIMSDYFPQTKSNKKKKIHKKRKKQLPIYLLINSPGGAVEPAFAFFDRMVGVHEIPLITLGHGMVASAAVIVFLAGEKRYIGRHANMILHDVKLPSDGSNRSSLEVDEEKTYKDNAKARYIELLASRTGLKKKKIRKFIRWGKVLRAEEIVDLGFAHAIF